MAEEQTMATGFMDDDTVVFTERKRWVFLGLPWTFTKYTITPNLLTTDAGFFKTVEDDCYMYKIQDVKLVTTFWERLVGISTLICYTGDITNPELKLMHIKHAKEIKAYLLKTSEEARIKRRTIHTQDIGVHGTDLDMDGIPDSME